MDYKLRKNNLCYYSFVHYKKELDKKLIKVNKSIDKKETHQNITKKAKILKALNIIDNLVVRSKSIEYTITENSDFDDYKKDALNSYSDYLLKLLEKEKKNARALSEKIKKAIDDGISHTRLATYNAKNGRKWEYIRNIEVDLSLLKEFMGLLQNNKN